jgi:hypothetical protein
MKPADPSELRSILELWAAGVASIDIACQLGLTKNQVLGRIWRYRRKGLADAPAMRIRRPRNRKRRPKMVPKPAPLLALALGDDIDKRRMERKVQNKWTANPRQSAPKPPKAVAAPPTKKPAIDWAARLVEPIPADAVLFAERRMGFQCSWIFTDTSKPPAMCCGHATMAGSEYCQGHYARTRREAA